MSDSQKSIAIFKSQALRIGGLEKQTQKIQQAFEDKGWDVHLLTTGKNTCGTVFPEIKGPSFRKIKCFDQQCQYWAKRYKPDVTLSIDRTSNSSHIRAGNGCHRAYLERRSSLEGFFKKWSFSINPLHRTVLQIEKASVENPQLKAIITNSEMVRQEFLSYYNVDPKKIFVVHNGVEYGLLQKPFDGWQKTKQEMLTRLDLPKDHFHLLFMGNGFARKGLKPLMQALAIIPEKNISLSVVGKDKHSDAFKKLAIDLGMENRVHFWGAQPNPYDFYAMADCLAIPSYYDPFANVTVEALAMGLQVISSKSNGGHEILDSHHQIIENLFSLESIADSLSKALISPKTTKSAGIIRESVKHLDFSNQLDTFVQIVNDTL